MSNRLYEGDAPFKPPTYLVKLEREIREKLTPDEIIGDPVIVGPGVWYSLHRMAIKAVYPDTKRDFVRNAKDLIDGFKCPKCRRHAQNFMLNNPIESFNNIRNAEGVDVGMFRWTWLFHNTVNVRLGKPTLDWDTAYAMYANAPPTVCQRNCGKQTEHDEDEDTDPPIKSPFRFKSVDVY